MLASVSFILKLYHYCALKFMRNANNCYVCKKVSRQLSMKRRNYMGNRFKLWLVFIWLLCYVRPNIFCKWCSSIFWQVRRINWREARHRQISNDVLSLLISIGLYCMVDWQWIRETISIFILFMRQALLLFLWNLLRNQSVVGSLGVQLLWLHKHTWKDNTFTLLVYCKDVRYMFSSSYIF